MYCVWPTDAAVAAVGPKPWLFLLYNRTTGLQPEGLIRADVFLLAVSLGKGDALSLEVTQATFQRVHDYIRQDRLPIGAWDMLERLSSPRTDWWWREDDRSLRLRRGLVSAFLRNGWPSTHFAACFGDLETLQAAVQDMDEVPGGAEFRRELRHIAESAAFVNTQFSAHDLGRAIRRRGFLF
jgi:hypothetical protein